MKDIMSGEKAWLLFTVFCFSFGMLPRTHAQQRMTLQECIEQALESSYSIKIARNLQQVADNNASYAPFLPTLGVNAKQTQNNTDNKTITNGEERTSTGAVSNVLSAGVALNWRLFDGLGMFTTYERYQEILAIGELDTQLAIENLIITVSAAYYDVIMQHSKLEAAAHTLELSTERYKEAHDKYVIGVLSGLDAQQAKSDLNADSSDYMQQKELLKGAYITLNKAMNIDLQRTMYVQDSIVLGTPMIFKDLQYRMLVRNTTLQKGQRDKKVSELDMKLARAALFPTLDFNSGYNYSRTKAPVAATSLNRSSGLYWGFTLNIDLFNRLDTRRKLNNAKLEAENAGFSYQEVELQLRADLAQLYNVYENNLQIVGFEKENAAIAFDNLDAALEKYKIGSLSGIEFREFQRSYIDAVDRKVTALYRAKISELSLLFISGGLLYN